MKLAICLAAAAVFLGVCRNSHSACAPLGQGIIEYQNQDNQYVVVVVQEDGLSLAKAKEKALQKAAEITVQNGYRYFKIESEQKTQVIQANKPWPGSQGFYGNMYQELIIEKDFDRDRMQREVPTESVYPALRVVFNCFKDKPLGKSVDACASTDCNG